ncbi:hypothetical protein [Nocardia sp. XZ_19_369]|uniref:hypothetical protein n=1 Tax=Nocardia sp. XZ_19_369 TaxID=2769487 RepID=UPI001E648427|nr:hypothetical protein [Nocardia sp. XZ_19_369]
MQGNWCHDRAHYRCRFPSEYAIANQIDHPASVYVREDEIIGPLDSWLARIFRPDQIEHSLTMLESAQPDGSAAVASMRSIRQSVTEYDRKLNSYRAALEAGTDPQLIATWTRQVQSEREVVVAQLAAMEATAKARPALSSNEIRELVKSLGGLVKILRAADPTDKLEVYRQLGLKMTYNHETRVVVAEVQPPPPVGVIIVSGGGHTR